jgi:hypothetical protein
MNSQDAQSLNTTDHNIRLTENFSASTELLNVHRSFLLCFVLIFTTLGQTACNKSTNKKGLLYLHTIKQVNSLPINILEELSMSKYLHTTKQVNSLPINILKVLSMSKYIDVLFSYFHDNKTVALSFTIILLLSLIKDNT